MNASVRKNLRVATSRWQPGLTVTLRQSLASLTDRHALSVADGDILLLDSSWYVTHSGLLRVAKRNRCCGIEVAPVEEFCDPAMSRWAFKATVFKSKACKGFVGYGDADPSNVSPRVRGAEMRVAETRAVNRALRKAYAIGICSVEEIGSFSGPLPSGPAQPYGVSAASKTPSGNGNGHLLRDQLCLLIRKHRLDPAKVKAYAAEFCGVTELRNAKREQIEAFVAQLGTEAEHDRDGLICHLNSYASVPAKDQAEQSLAGAA